MKRTAVAILLVGLAVGLTGCYSLRGSGAKGKGACCGARTEKCSTAKAGKCAKCGADKADCKCVAKSADKAEKCAKCGADKADCKCK